MATRPRRHPPRSIREGFGERESVEDAADPYRAIVRDALERIAVDAGGIAWIEVWARTSSALASEGGATAASSDKLHLQTSWMSPSARMAARPDLAARLLRPAETCDPGNGGGPVQVEGS